MELYAYCFMPNHVHMIFRSGEEKPMELLQSFKKYTAKKVIETIEGNSQESRKEWLLWMLERAGKNMETFLSINFGNIITSQSSYGVIK